MTREEIKDQATREVFHPEFNYRSLSNGVKVGNLKQRHLEEVLDKAMDAYARQEAIEFQNWIDKSEIVYEDIAKCYVKDDAFFCDTVAQLYDLFLTYKNKNNG